MGDGRRVAIVIAAIALGIGALAAMAYFVGWLPAQRAAVAAAPAKPATAAVTIQSGIVLLPGETLVEPPGPVVEPSTVSAPAVPAPPPPAAPARAPSPPKYNKPAPRPPPPELAAEAPRPPPPARYPREERRPGAYERSARSVCVNCGVVTGIARGDYDWEVRVRFEDGSRDTLRFYDRPRFRVGDPVHLEDGRLLPD